MTREHPSSIVILRDLSDSMKEEFGADTSKTKAERLNTAINRQLANITIECAKEDGIRDYFDVAVVGYSGSRGVDTSWEGDLSGRELVSVSELKENPLRVEDRKEEKVDDAGNVREVEVKFPVWFEPKHGGGTPMCEALEYTHDLLNPWVNKNQNSFPPIVVNITDGRSTDGDPREAANKLRNLSTNDGELLLFNIHITKLNQSPILYPNPQDKLPSEHAETLFEMSSPLPSVHQKGLQNEGYSVDSDSRGYVFNAGAVEMIRGIQTLIGSPIKELPKGE